LAAKLQLKKNKSLFFNKRDAVYRIICGNNDNYLKSLVNQNVRVLPLRTF